MSAAKYRELSIGELRKKLATEREKLLNQRLRKCAGQVDDLVDLRRLRRDIARLKTIISEKTSS